MEVLSRRVLEDLWLIRFGDIELSGEFRYEGEIGDPVGVGLGDLTRFGPRI